jgi:hypothetical protein
VAHDPWILADWSTWLLRRAECFQGSQQLFVYEIPLYGTRQIITVTGMRAKTKTEIEPYAGLF